MSAACQAPKSVGSAASAGGAASAAVRSSGSAGTGTAWAQFSHVYLRCSCGFHAVFKAAARRRARAPACARTRACERAHARACSLQSWTMQVAVAKLDSCEGQLMEKGYALVTTASELTVDTPKTTSELTVDASSKLNNGGGSCSVPQHESRFSVELPALRLRHRSHERRPVGCTSLFQSLYVSTGGKPLS